MEDAFGKTFQLTALVIFLFFALRPDWSIKLLSYGTADAGKINNSVLLSMRLLSAFCACGIFIYLVATF